MRMKLLDEIERLRADKVTHERIGSVIMSLEGNLKELRKKSPAEDSTEYSAWEEKYYEIKHLIEYAQRLEDMIKDRADIAMPLEDLKAAARDFGRIYGGLKTWKPS